MTITQTERSPPLRMLSSMATRHVLAEIAGWHERQGGCPVELVSMGGVDAAQRVRAGEPFDVVVLASSAMESLVGDGWLRADTVLEVTKSDVAVAVPSGSAIPDISTEAALRHAVESAPSLSYSTGPSGAGLLALFKRWGILERMQDRLIQAPAGVPVAQCIAQGRVAMGFQQLSEIQGVDGVTVLGIMPAACAIVSTFSGAVTCGSTRPQDAATLLASLTSPAVDGVKVKHGMSPPVSPWMSADAPPTGPIT